MRGARKQFNAMENERISQTSTDSRTVAKGDSQRGERREGEGRLWKSGSHCAALCCWLHLAAFDALTTSLHVCSERIHTRTLLTL